MNYIKRREGPREIRFQKGLPPAGRNENPLRCPTGGSPIVVYILPSAVLVSGLQPIERLSARVRRCLVPVTQRASERSLGGPYRSRCPSRGSGRSMAALWAERGRTKDRGDARRGSRDDRPDPAFVRTPAIVRFDPAQVRGRRTARPSTPDNACGGRAKWTRR